MKLAYKGIDRNGATVADVIESSSIPEAIESLRQEGLFITDIQESSGKKRVWRGTNVGAGAKASRLTLNELLLFTRQMAMLLRAGSPVVPALVAIAKQMKSSSRSVVDKIRRDMEGGRGLADAMKEFPHTFPETYIAVVGAGEMSANLPDMFTRLATMVTRKREIRNRIISATAYPALLICLSFSIVMTMVVFVVPRFKALFASLNSPLPWSTKLMFGVSLFLRGHWPWFLGAGVVAVTVVVLLCKTAAGRQRLCDWQTRIPLAGKLFARLILAQMYRVMGLLLESRVGLMETLQLAGRISSNKDYQTLLTTMTETVEQGDRLGDAVSRSAMVPPSIAQAVVIGEESGHLDQAMLFVADIQDEDNAQMIDALTKLIEPIILIGMGFVVGAIALSLFIPLFDLAAMAG
ncbi:MAG: type II secretion system F family protein [Planctomycetes bacterium]|nr:type II secretion system F family protein [Planctomycetota bacterium]